MDQDLLNTWVTPGVAILGALIVLGQVVIQRQQRHLQEAESYRQQADMWASLADSWETALLPAIGRDAWQFGVHSSRADEYFEAVERYRQVYVAFLDPKEIYGSSSDYWEKLAADEQAALDVLGSYRRSVQRVVTHLAQVSGMVLRKQVPLEAAYDAFGLEVIQVGDKLFKFLQCSFEHGSSCVAPGNMERALWKKLHAEQVSSRIGWGAFLDVARGSAERTALFLDLLKAHAIKVGDLDCAFDNGVDEECPAAQLAKRDRLAVAWRGARFNGRLRAIGLVAKLAATGRRVKRRERSRFRFQIEIAWKLESRRWWTGGLRLPLRRWVRAPVDALLVPLDVSGAAIRARTVRDPRRMDPPELAARDFGVDAF